MADAGSRNGEKGLVSSTVEELALMGVGGWKGVPEGRFSRRCFLLWVELIQQLKYNCEPGSQVVSVH